MFAAIAGLSLAIWSSWKIIWWLQFYLSKKCCSFVLVRACSSNRRQAWERYAQAYADRIKLDIFVYKSTIIKMKKLSEEHFEQMKMISEYFDRNSRNSEYFQLYEAEAEASKLINSIIEYETDSKIGIEKINYIINEIEQKQHQNGVHWFDFIIHVNAVININK